VSAARGEAETGAQRASVVMTGSRCVASARTPVIAGVVLFSVQNRSARLRRFAIAGRRTRFLPARGKAVLRVAVGAGRAEYACTAKGLPRSIHRGVLRVGRPSAAPRILYSSDWSGNHQLYAADPSGRKPTGQLTFGPAPACQPDNPCGFVNAVPSPDGRRVLFSDRVDQGPLLRTLFVATAAGRDRRPIATVNDFRVSGAWSPDSRRIAYGASGGLWIAGADGTRPHVVVSTERVWALAWSPNGESLAYVSSGLNVVRPDGSGFRPLTSRYVSGFSWSPDGRRLAFGDDGIKIADLATGVSRTLTDKVGAVDELAWSPDGTLLAYATRDGIGLADIAAGGTRMPSTDTVANDSSPTWSPDGRELAYVRVSPPFGLYSTTDLRVVDRLGHARTVVSGGESFGGSISGVAWTRPPAGSDYRPAAPRSLASVSPEELVAPRAVTQLATDGARVAYVACGHVFVWTPDAGSVEQAEPQSSLSPRCNAYSYYSGLGIYSLAIAGERVAFGLIGGGITRFWWLGGTTTGASRTAFTLGEGQATTGGPRTGFVGDLAGSGPLLVFSSGDQQWADGQCCIIETIRQQVLRADSSDCPCPVLAVEPGPFVPHDVADGRIVAVGASTVVVLDAQGTRLLTVPVSARSAQLAGGELVLSLEAELRRYDARTGELLGARPLAPGFRLEDAARGLVAYVVGGQVHLVRLADGAGAVVAPGTLARFSDSGLVYVDGTRIRLVRFERLPIRGAEDQP
jgi:Tol biopolymer transport system component